MRRLDDPLLDEVGQAHVGLDEVEAQRLGARQVAVDQCAAVERHPAGVVDARAVERLAGQSLGGIAVRDDLGRKLQAHLAPLAPAPRISTWVQTYQVARSLVSAGHGIALLDPFTAHGDDSIQVRPLEPAVAVSLHAVHRNDAGLSTLQEACLRETRELGEQLLAAWSGLRRPGRPGGGRARRAAT